MLSDGADSPRFERKNPVEQAQSDFEQISSILVTQVEPAQPEYFHQKPRLSRLNSICGKLEELEKK